MSGRTTVLRFLSVYHAIGKNSSKMAITLEGRPMGTYPFEVFHTSLGSTLCTESELKSDLSVESVSSLDLRKSANKLFGSRVFLLFQSRYSFRKQTMIRLDNFTDRGK